MPKAIIRQYPDDLGMFLGESVATILGIVGISVGRIVSEGGTYEIRSKNTGDREAKVTVTPEGVDVTYHLTIGGVKNSSGEPNMVQSLAQGERLVLFGKGQSVVIKSRFFA